MMKNKFINNVIVLISGTLFSQVILLLSTPILTRLYTTEEFGLLSFFVSILGVLSVASSLRYNRAIPLPNTDKVAKDVLLIGQVIVSLFSLVFVFFVFINYIFSFYESAYSKYFIFLPLAIFSVGMYDLYNYWGIRVGSFKEIAKGKLIQTLLTVIIQVLFFSFGGVSLIIGHTLGLFFGFIFLYKRLKSSLTSNSYNYLRGLFVAKRYKDFPKYSTWEALANSLGNNSPIIIVGFIFGSSVAGLYALTYKVLSLPMNMIGSAIGQAYFSKISKAYKDGDVSNITIKLFKILCGLGFPAAILLMFIGPSLFKLSFGPDWVVAGEYSQVMSPWLLMIFLTSPLSSIISVSERQKDALKFQVLFLLSKISVIYIGGTYFNDYITILMLSLTSTLLLIFFMVWMLSLSKIKLNIIINVLFNSLIFSILCNIPLIILKFYPSNNNIFLGAIFLSVIFILIRYYILSWEFKYDSKNHKKNNYS